jgi:hypothetical protein
VVVHYSAWLRYADAVGKVTRLGAGALGRPECGAPIDGTAATAIMHAQQIAMLQIATLQAPLLCCTR